MCKCIDLNGKDSCGLTQFMNVENNENETFKSNFQPLWQKFYPSSPLKPQTFDYHEIRGRKT